MDKHERNKSIAMLLGFRPYGIEVNGKKNARIAWSYPDEFKGQQCQVPEDTVPDFVKILTELAKDCDMFMTRILKRDILTAPTIEDMERGLE